MNWQLYPELPPVPDVVPFEDVPAQECLQKWAKDYAEACVNNYKKRLIQGLFPEMLPNSGEGAAL